jgi:hypothetical protein
MPCPGLCWLHIVGLACLLCFSSSLRLCVFARDIFLRAEQASSLQTVNAANDAVILSLPRSSVGASRWESRAEAKAREREEETRAKTQRRKGKKEKERIDLATAMPCPGLCWLHIVGLACLLCFSSSLRLCVFARDIFLRAEQASSFQTVSSERCRHPLAPTLQRGSQSMGIARRGKGAKGRKKKSESV